MKPGLLLHMHSQIWMSSEEHLNVHFNPAGLLSVGDALAFARALTAPPPMAASFPAQLGAPTSLCRTEMLVQGNP